MPRDLIQTPPVSAKSPVYSVGADGRCRIEHFDEGPAFSSFLPGIAGRDGVPLWAMYVNRGQAIVSFGPCSKDSAILEFLPATWAYQLVGVQGLRTLCKVDGEFFEPFQRNEASLAQDFTRAMEIDLDRVIVEEINSTHGLDFRAEHFALVERAVPALVRRMTITNSGASPRRLEVLDGLPLMQPAGFTDEQMKKTRRLSEAYASVRELGGGLVYHSARVKAHDEAEVIEVSDGNFFAAWLSGHGDWQSLDPLVDPDVVFGPNQDLITPRCFIAEGGIRREDQIWENRLGCALAPFECLLAPGDSVTLHALIGWAPQPELAEELAEEMASPDAFERASEESRELLRDVSDPAFMVSAHPSLDAYARQNWIDNVLRGGVPVMVPSRQGDVPVHLYTRRHGDLERDYNGFHLAPHPLSDGAGHFRDICQNRRSDVWFFPEVGDAEIRLFVSLLQADGYNPLHVRGHLHVAPEGLDAETLCPGQSPEAQAALRRILKRPFAPGELLGWLNEHRIDVGDPWAWLCEVLRGCDHRLVAGGHEGGHWIDHWTYIVDLLEGFAAIWPDRLEAMLTEDADIPWFDDGCHVRPRTQKHRLRPWGPLQIGAEEDVPPTDPPLAPVTVLGKLLGLAAIKAVSFDFEGKGIEMEAGRPGWDDAMNGLPGMFGSSTCETAGLARLCRWLLDSMETIPATDLPAPVADLIRETLGDLREKEHDWDRACTIRERFRAKLREGSEETCTVSGDELWELLVRAETKARAGIDRSLDERTGLLHTYHSAAPREFEVLAEDGEESPRLNVKSLDQQPLPLFLEGQVNLLRLVDAERARKVWTAVRESPLFDGPLEMYRLNEDLSPCPASIGRARTFSRGWFENESIWLHMSHKYLLELLRLGLIEEFHTDARTMLVPFMDPEIYGRSVLENSSFIASSVNPDPKTHGRGFVARLSGTTAEFIHIWLLLTVGARPFRLEGDDLRFHLEPQLPGEWFTADAHRVTWRGEEHTIPADGFACAFMGRTLLVYHNPDRRDTHGPEAARPQRIALDGGAPQAFSSLSPADAERLRQRQIKRLDVWLG